MNPEKIRPKYNNERQPKIPANFKHFISKMTILAIDNSESVADNRANKLSKVDEKYINKMFKQLDFALATKYSHKMNEDGSISTVRKSRELANIIRQNIDSGLVYSAPRKTKEGRFAHSEQFLKEQEELLSDNTSYLQKIKINPDIPDIHLTPPSVFAALNRLVKDLKDLAGNRPECYEAIAEINHRANNVFFNYSIVDEKTGILRHMNKDEEKSYKLPAEDYSDIEHVAQYLNNQGYHL